MDFKLLPSPPTDNLYKFMAIFGAWALLILAVFLMGIGYVSFRGQQQAQHVMAYERSIGVIEAVHQRINAIQAGQLNEAIVSWSPLHDGSAAEKTFLLNVLQNNQAYMANHKVDPEQNDAWTFWQIFSATDGFIVVLVFGSVGIFCFLYGFRRWYQRVQSVSDAMLRSELAFQEMTNQKLQRELEAVTPTPPPPPGPPSA